MKKITENELYEFCKDHYYCDENGGKRLVWTPFEDYDCGQIEEYIDNDVLSLKRFLKEKGIVVKEN